MSIVEDTLRTQRESWREIVDRVSRVSSRDLPPEPPKRILLLGIGSSHYAAKLAGFALIRDHSRALRAPVISCSSMQVGSEVIPAKGDWVFGITHRGGTPATLHALEQADSIGAFTIAVTGKGAKEIPTAKMLVETSELERCEPHTVSMSGAICAITTLLLGARVIDEWDALRSLGDPNPDAMLDRAGKGPNALLGEWEGEWLAREGALKLMEMARLQVRCFGSEEYFHGPKLAARDSDLLWHVSTPRDPRNDEITAFRSVNRVTVHGTSPLAWVPALVELQWLALAVARNLGVDPDGKS